MDKNEINSLLTKDKRNIKCLSDYKNNKTRMEWECLVCGYRWFTTHKSVMGKQKTGCSKCKQNFKYDNESIDKKLAEIDSSFVREENYINSKTKIKFKCKVCDEIRIVEPIKMLTRTPKCKKCDDYIDKLTNEIFDDRIKIINSEIERISDITNCGSTCRFGCKKCGYEWETKPNNILSTNKTGCAKCNGGLKLETDEVDNYLKSTKFKRIDNYKNNSTKMKFLCNDCGEIFESTFASIKLNESCKVCDQTNLTDDLIDSRLEQYNIKRIDKYVDKIKIGKKVKIRFQCLKESCNNIWLADVYNVTNGVSGCPFCRNKREELVFRKIEEKLETEVVRQKKFHFKNRRFYADFYFSINNKEYMVEYNGKQHYEPIGFFGGEPSFNKQTKRDELFKEYCDNKNIKLIEIPYWCKIEHLNILEYL